MIRKKEIERLPALPAKARGKDRFVGRARMHGDAIVLDVYDAGMFMVPEGEEKDAEISFRWVCDKKNYGTYVFRPGAWTNQSIYYAMYGQPRYCGDAGIRLDKNGKEIVKEFLKGVEVEGWRSRKGVVNRLCDLEDDIRERKREREQELREARIEARQKKRKPLPKDWEPWLRNHVFREERYLFYDGGKRKFSVCAYCGENVSLDGTQKHNGWGKCPACGSRIRYKAVGRARSMRDEKQAVYLQKTPDGFLTRYFKVRKDSSARGEKYQSHEVALVTYDGKRTWCDYHVNSGFTGNDVWVDAKPGCMSGWKAKGYLYTRNAKAALKGTRLQYAPLAEWMRHERREIPVGNFLGRIEGEPFLEFFVKVGLFRLTREYVDGYEKWRCNGGGPKEILGMNKQRINRLVRLDGGLKMLNWLQYEEEKGIRITDWMLTWLEENEVSVFRCKNILEEIGSVERMVGYMKRQEIPPYDVAVTWSDYLRMAKAEGMDTTDDIVRLPKNLKQRHDQLVELDDKRKDAERLKGYAELDEKIRERLPQVERYRWKNDEYVMIPAVKCEELMVEGRTLHHCVGRDDHYMGKMAEGETWILFLRKKREVEKPYYTIEIDLASDEILQWYSEFDRKPDGKAVKKVLDAFLKSVEKKREREQARSRVLLESA